MFHKLHHSFLRDRVAQVVREQRDEHLKTQVAQLQKFCKLDKEPAEQGKGGGVSPCAVAPAEASGRKRRLHIAGLEGSLRRAANNSFLNS